jgi:asparagine synthase (glutamine-hydrolysing)
MLRFVAYVWHVQNESQRFEAERLREGMRMDQSWTVALDEPGVFVFCAGIVKRAVECYEAPGREGVVLGKLFRRNADARSSVPVQLAPDAATRIVESGGRELVKNYWGQYVAVLRQQRTGRVFILQCPNAGRPVYRASRGGVTVYFTEWADVKTLKPEVDWEYVSAHLIAPVLRTERTAIQGVSELQRGHCDEHSANRLVTHAYWSVASFAGRQRYELEDCKGSLREAVKSSVDHWAACHDKVIHLLSGGLDSSIVLGCLARSPLRPEIACVTHFGRAGGGTDERLFARIAAQAAGCNHVELPLQDHIRLEAWDAVSLTPRPGFYLSVAQELEILALARELGATAIMSGSGGDAAFCEHADIEMAADYLHDHGLSPALIEMIVATALVTETSVWTVARATMKLARRNRSDSNIVAASLPFRKLPSATAVRLARGTLPQSMGSGGRVLPAAKARHALMVSQPMMARSNIANLKDPEFVDPLTSDLVSESCMEIPVYVHCQNGRTRWLARDVFQDVVPDVLLKRTTKGNPEPYVDRVRDENAAEIEARLMDGELVRHGILEADSIRAALDGKPGAASATELLGAYGVELWAGKLTRQRLSA